MAATYEPIASTTLGSDASSITFSGIPQSFTDLVCIFKNASNGSLSSNSSWAQFNSDAAANYSDTRLYGNGTSALSARSTSATTGVSLSGKIDNGVTVLHIMSYANTNVYKTCLASSEGLISGAHSVLRIVGLWRSTAAITSVSFVNNTTFKTGAVASLYGIKAA